jgi:hypothetical protein
MEVPIQLPNNLAYVFCSGKRKAPRTRRNATYAKQSKLLTNEAANQRLCRHKMESQQKNRIPNHCKQTMKREKTQRTKSNSIGKINDGNDPCKQTGYLGD